jgi:HEAT repeat-containing taxis protein
VVNPMASIEEQRLKKWIKVLHGKDAEMSRIAAEKLGEIGNPVAIPDLEKALHTRTMFVAAVAAKSLGKIGNKSAVASLLKILANHRQDVVVRTAAAEALGIIGHHSAISGLEAVVNDHMSKYRNDRFNLIQGYERGLFITAIRSLKQIGTPTARRIAAKAEKF